MKMNILMEKHLAIMKTKFLAGDSLTASDFDLYNYITNVALNKNVIHENVKRALSANHGTS